MGSFITLYTYNVFNLAQIKQEVFEHYAYSTDWVSVIFCISSPENAVSISEGKNYILPIGVK